MSLFPTKTQTGDSIHIGVLICKVEDDLRIVKGPVLRPEIRDRQKTIVSAEVIREAAHDFALRLNLAKDGTGPGFMHRDFKRKLGIVETWLLDHDTWYPRGDLSSDDLSASKLTEDLVALENPSAALEDSEFAAPYHGSGEYNPIGDRMIQRSLLRYKTAGDLDPTLLRVALAKFNSVDFRIFGKYAASVRRSARDALKTAAMTLRSATNDEILAGEVDDFMRTAKAQEDAIFMPAGSWMAGMKVWEDDIWAGVKNKTYKGFSIGGRAQIEYED